MNRLSPGQIYLADERGETATGQYISRHTFNYGSYGHTSRGQFGSLCVFNDDILMPGQNLYYEHKQNKWLMLLPLTGAITCQISDSEINLDVEQIWIVYAPANTFLTIQNPSESGQVNFFYAEFIADTEVADFSAVFDFDLANQADVMDKLLPSSVAGIVPFSVSLGHFAGRQDALCRLKDTENLFFGFALNGAFEMQGRLLHQRDALALWDITEVDMEALSNNAVMLTIEMKKAGFKPAF